VAVANPAETKEIALNNAHFNPVVVKREYLIVLSFSILKTATALPKAY
jgi:hypothetical protein